MRSFACRTDCRPAALGDRDCSSQIELTKFDLDCNLKVIKRINSRNSMPVYRGIREEKPIL